LNSQRVMPGDLVAIPAGEGRQALAKVLYVSERYKDVILLGVSAEDASETRAEEISWLSYGLLIYASQVPIRRGRWPRLGSTSLSAEDESRSRRVVAGDVWEGDVHLGPASDEDMLTLPRMSVAGSRLVERKVARLFAPKSP
jgi:hypothetical protein